MSHFTLGVVNVGGGECRGGECRTILLFVGFKKKLTVTGATYIQIPISAHGWRQYIGLYGVRPLTKLQSLSFGTNLDPAHINIMQKAACSLSHLEGVSKTSICIC